MRHQSQEFLETFHERHPEKKTVLEVGSLDVNGNIQGHCRGWDWPYLGTDMREGPNVDEVVNGHELKKHFGDRQFDLVICFDTFEHDDAFWLTLEQMKAVLKPGGYLMLGFPSRYCPEHDHPHDYWRFMPQSMPLMFDGYEDFIMQVDKNGETEDEIYGYGRKPCA